MMTEQVEVHTSHPMRVGYLVNSYPMPSLTFIRREIAALEDLGIDVVRYAIRDAELPLVDEADRAEYDRTTRLLDHGWPRLGRAVLTTAVTKPKRFLRTALTAMRSGRASDRGQLVHLVYLAEACLLERLTARDGVAHVHTHFATNAATVAMLSRMLGGPSYSIAIHGPEEFDAPRGLSLGLKVERAAFVTAISSYARSQIWRWSDTSCWGRVHIVRCGLDQSFLDHPATDPPEEPRLVSVGRLSEQKGQGVMVAAAEILERRGRSFHLQIIGDGDLRSELEAQIDRAGVTGMVEIAGWRTGQEIRHAIDRSRALVLSSFAEGLPVVIMEALALERPVVTTAIAGVPELVHHGESGWLVPAGSAEALADALEGVLDASPTQLRQMGAAGRKQVVRDHDVRQEARRLAELFRATLGAADPISLPTGADPLGHAAR